MPPEPPSSGLRAYDTGSVIVGAAALALWPANADRMLALDELAAAVARDPVTRGRTAGVRTWRMWLASDASRPVRQIEPDGICDCPPLVEASVQGQRRALIGGFLDAPDLLLNMWMASLTQAHTQTGDATLAHALELLEIAAVISDRVVRMAQLETHPWPSHHPERRIVVPDAKRLRLLGRALTLSASERAELGPGVEQLVSQPGDDDPGRPLREVAGGLLLARPPRLLLAAMMRAEQLAHSGSAWERVVAALREQAISVIDRAALDMDWQPRDLHAAAVVADIDRDLEAVLVPVIVIPDNRDPVVDAAGAVDEALRALPERGPRASTRLIFACLVGDGRPVMYTRPEVPEGARALVLRLGDLRLLGDALRRDPLAITRAMTYLPPETWPVDASVPDMIGLHRVMEDSTPLDDLADLDGAECLHRTARTMSGRHPAPSPDAPGRWIAVSRWAGNDDDSLFYAEEDIGRFALLVRGPGSFIWVVASDPSADRWDIVGQVCVTLAIWIGQLQHTGWRLINAFEFATRITVKLEPTHVEPVVLQSQSGGPLLCFGPAFIELACQGDNAADRLLLTSLLEHWAGANRSDAISQLVDRVVPAGRGTLLLWPEPTVMRNQPRLTAPRPVTDRELRLVERPIVERLLDGDEFTMSERTDSEAVLDRLVTLTSRQLDEGVAALDEHALVELVTVHERAAALTHAEAVALPARAQLPDGMPALGAEEATGEAAVALRWLIERVSAGRPAGANSLSLERELRLRAGAQLLVRWGSILEAVRTGQAYCQIALSEPWGVQIAMRGPLADARGQAAEQLTAAAPDLMAAEHSDWWYEPRPEPTLELQAPIPLPDRYWQQVDRAMLDTWGFSYEQSLRLLRAVSMLADRKPTAVATRTRDELTTDLTAMTSLPVGVVDSFIDRFSLREDDAYDVLRWTPMSRARSDFCY